VREIIVGVVHDFDGVLLDSIFCTYKAYRPLFEWKKINITYDQYRKLIGGDYNNFLRLIGVGESELVSAADIWNKEYRKYASEIGLYTGAREYLRRLKDSGRKIAIATGGNQRRVNIEIDRFGIRRFIDAIVTFQDVEKHKPSGDPILAALKKLDCKADESVYIGDAKDDILAARNAGVKSIFMTGGLAEIEDLDVKPDAIAESFSELYERIDSF